jgi:hypothetical protein
MTGFFLVGYPVYGAVGIYRNIDRLEDEKTLEQFGILYQD